MIALPRQLAPWAGHLALFPEDVALTIGPMVARLAGLVGGWPQDHAPHGTPDGLDGLSVRGPYDRLLSSEWALLEDLPDEFLRRAISGEHLFLQRAYQEPAGVRETVVLFDAGPDQLGAPRLAHLAILIVLAQRAAEHKAGLHWSTFQDRDRQLQAGATKSSVIELLRARCEQPVAADDVQAWMASEGVQAASECWFVGGEEVAAAARDVDASALIVSDILDPSEPSRIRVTAVSPRQAHAREVMLDVPHSPAAVRVLRNPFDTHVPDRKTTSLAISPNSNIVFAVDGRRLYVRGDDGHVVAIQIPNSPRAQVRRPWRFTAPEGHVILAVGQNRSKRRAVVLSQREDELAVHVLTKRGGIADLVSIYKAKDYRLPEPTAEMPLRPLAVIDRDLCFIDHRGNLVELSDGRFVLRDEAAAVAWRVIDDGLAYVETRHGAPRVIAARGNPSGIEISALDMPLKRMDGARYYFGGYALLTVLACPQDGSPCQLFQHRDRSDIAVPRTHTAIGLVERGADKLEKFVVAIDPTRTRIDAFGLTTHETLLTTSTPIMSAAAAETENIVAFVTSTGEVGVYSCRFGTMVLQIAGERS